MKIAILYGTETGNAEMLAEDIADHLTDHDTEVVNLSDFPPDGFDPSVFHLIVCSTYGDGELPGSAKPFAEAMAARTPDLSRVCFSIFGLGDSEYGETFNHGSKRLTALLVSHGATQLGDRVIHDASGPDLAEDLAMEWVDDMVALAAEQLGETVR